MGFHHNCENLNRNQNAEAPWKKSAGRRDDAREGRLGPDDRRWLAQREPHPREAPREEAAAAARAPSHPGGDQGGQTGPAAFGLHLVLLLEPTSVEATAAAATEPTEPSAQTRATQHETPHLAELAADGPTAAAAAASAEQHSPGRVAACQDALSPAAGATARGARLLPGRRGAPNSSWRLEEVAEEERRELGDTAGAEVPAVPLLALESADARQSQVIEMVYFISLPEVGKIKFLRNLRRHHEKLNSQRFLKDLRHNFIWLEAIISIWYAY